MLVAILPVLLLAAATGQLTTSRQESDGAARLHEAAVALQEHIGGYVSDHERGVQTLASALAVSHGTGAERLALLQRYHEVYPGFVTIFVSDPAGTVREIFPPRDSPAPSINDREYFVQARRTGALAVSDVIIGRLSHVPITTIAIPYTDEAGAVVGVAGGSLDLSRFDRFLEGFRTLSEARITVVDQHDRVIYASDPEAGTALNSLAGSPLLVSSAKAEAGIFRYSATSSAGSESPRLAAMAVVVPTGWKVFIEQPLLALRLQTLGYYGFTLAVMMLALVGAVLGARAFSSAVTLPLEEVITVVRNISANGVQAGTQLASDPPAEIASLLHDVNSMQIRLGESYQQLETALAQREDLNTELRALTEDLDRKVRERTAELVAATQHGRGSEPREERVPREHEPRDSDADERHHRHDRSRARHRALDRTARISRRWSRRRPTRC